MQTLLTVFHIFLAVGLVGLILIQHGKGADMGAAFGSGASGTVFGAKGSASFLTRTTAILATLFFVTSIAMGYYATQREAPKGVMEGFGATQEAPATEPGSSDIPPVTVDGQSGVPAPAASDMPPVAPQETSVPAPASSDMPPVAPQETSIPDNEAPEAAVTAESEVPASDNVSQDGDNSTTSDEKPAGEVNQK
ncbi:MAG: preprotein translocase subunit SecG [Candidatus Thiodiazotropha sp.]